MSNTPPAPYHPFPAAPQQQLTYVPAWPAVQSGPLLPMPPTHPAPPALVSPPAPPFQAPPAPMPVPLVTPPVTPPQHFSYPPGGWGPVPNYYLAPAQPYLISYPC